MNRRTVVTRLASGVVGLSLVDVEWIPTPPTLNIPETEKEGPAPAMLMQQLQQAQQMIEAFTKELNAKNDLIEKEQYKLDAASCRLNSTRNRRN